MIITIDGPAGTGKSTVARQLAQRLGMQYLDTGAMYRAVAWVCLKQGVDPHDPAATAEVAASIRIDLGEGQVQVDGQEISHLIREPEVSTAASLIAAHPAVRSHLVDRQRCLATGRRFVCEGRDQGTIVFPQAEHKFFLTATAEERARRRQEELAQRGIDVPLEELVLQQRERDERDLSREVAPLKPAEDAVLIDTTGLTVDAVVDLLESRVRSQGLPG